MTSGVMMHLVRWMSCCAIHLEERTDDRITNDRASGDAPGRAGIWHTRIIGRAAPLVFRGIALAGGEELLGGDRFAGRHPELSSGLGRLDRRQALLLGGRWHAYGAQSRAEPKHLRQSRKW